MSFKNGLLWKWPRKQDCKLLQGRNLILQACLSQLLHGMVQGEVKEERKNLCIHSTRHWPRLGTEALEILEIGK